MKQNLLNTEKLDPEEEYALGLKPNLQINSEFNQDLEKENLGTLENDLEQNEDLDLKLDDENEIDEEKSEESESDSLQIDFEDQNEENNMSKPEITKEEKPEAINV